MATAIDNLAVVISADASQIGPTLIKAQRDFQQFAKSVQGIKPPELPTLKGGGVRALAAEYQGVSNSLRSVGESSRSAAAGIGMIGAKALITGGSLLALETGFSGLSDVMGTLKDSVVKAADLESTKLAFEVMLGSAEKATSMLGEIRKFAAETPFQIPELQDSARKLIAYGVAVDQVIPTIKMLGDISSGTQKKISDLSYVYGTLATQGRAYTKDLHQLTDRGIDINPGLAKQFNVTKQEIQALTEEGRIGFAEVGKAMEALTLPGGKFFDLTRRQGQTLAGLASTALDAFEMGKVRLGEIIIEEVGLKQVAKDLEAFFTNATGGLDKLRPAIHFVGDLVKAGAQLGYEFGKAGIAIASINIDNLKTSFPQLGKAAESIADVVKNLADFKIDEKSIITAAFDIAIAFKGIGDVITTEVLPGIRAFAENMKAIANIPNKVGDFLEGGKAPNAPSVNPPRQGMSADEIRRNWVFIERLARVSPNPELDAKYKREFLAGFADPAKAEEVLKRGEVPPLRNDGGQFNAKPSLENIRDTMIATLEVRKLAESQAKAATEAKKLSDNFAQLGNQVGSVFLSGSLNPLANALSLGADQARTMGQGRIQFPNELPGNLVELSKEVKKQFGNPLPEIEKYRKDLDTLVEKNRITIDERNRAYADRIQRTGEQFGIGGETRLGGAALIGSSEDATILNRFSVGNAGPQKAEELLRLILQRLDEANRIAARTLDKTDPVTPMRLGNP